MFRNRFPTQSRFPPEQTDMSPMEMAELTRQREHAHHLRFQDPAQLMGDRMWHGNGTPFNNPWLRQPSPHIGDPPLSAPDLMPPTMPPGAHGMPMGLNPENHFPMNAGVLGHQPNLEGGRSLELERIERERQERERERQVDLRRWEQLQQELELERAKIRRKKEEEERQMKIPEDLERQGKEEHTWEHEREIQRQCQQELEMQCLQQERENTEQKLQKKIQQKLQRDHKANEKRRREELVKQQQLELQKKHRREKMHHQELQELEMQHVREMEILREKEAAVEKQMALNKEQQRMMAAASAMLQPNLPSVVPSANMEGRPGVGANASLMEKVKPQQPQGQSQDSKQPQDHNFSHQNRGRRENRNQQSLGSTNPSKKHSSSDSQPRISSLRESMDQPSRMTGFNEVAGGKRKHEMEQNERKNKRMAKRMVVSSDKVPVTSDFHTIIKVMLRMKPVLPPSLEWFCLPCEVQCLDVMNYHQHMTGKKHQARMYHVVYLAGGKSPALEALKSENHVARVKKWYESTGKSKSGCEADLCKVCMMYIFDSMENHKKSTEHKNAVKDQNQKCRICDEEITSLHDFLIHCNSHDHKMAFEIHIKKIKEDNAAALAEREKERKKEKTKIARRDFVMVDEVGFEDKGMKDKNVLAKALYDNSAEAPDELEFRQGDVVTVIEQNTNGLEGWWLCSLNGRQGIAPGNRLKIMAGMFDTACTRSMPRKGSEDKEDPFKNMPPSDQWKRLRYEELEMGEDDSKANDEAMANTPLTSTPNEVPSSAKDPASAQGLMQYEPWALGDSVHYDIQKIIGQEYVIPVTGYFCRVCKKFYCNEYTAKVNHCSSSIHFRNVKKYLNQRQWRQEAGETSDPTEGAKQEGAKQEMDAADGKETITKENDAKKEMAKVEDKQNESKTPALKNEREYTQKEKTGDDEVIEIESDDEEVVSIPDEDDEEAASNREKEEVRSQSDHTVQDKHKVDDEEERKENQDNKRNEDEKNRGKEEEKENRGNMIKEQEENMDKEEVKIMEKDENRGKEEKSKREEEDNKRREKEEKIGKEKDAERFDEKVNEGAVKQGTKKSQTAGKQQYKDPPQEEIGVLKKDSGRTTADRNVSQEKEEVKEQNDKRGTMEEERPTEEEITDEDAAMDYDSVALIEADDEFEMVVQDEIMDSTEDEEASVGS